MNYVKLIEGFDKDFFVISRTYSELGIVKLFDELKYDNHLTLANATETKNLYPMPMLIFLN